MSSIDIINVTPTAPEFVLSTSVNAEARRDFLLNLAADLPTVISTSAQADASATALREIRDFTKQIEESRTEVKAPYLALCKAIEAKAKELTLELEQQVTVIGRNLATFQEIERRRIADLQAKARAEEERIKAETAAKIADASDKYKTQAGFDRAVAKVEDKAMAQIMEARVPANQAGAARLLGVATRTEIKVEVTDIKALYAAFPHCVKMEANLALLKATIKSLGEGAVVPGVSYYKEAQTHVR